MIDPEVGEVLHTMTEVSATFVGFSLIASVLEANKDKVGSRIYSIRDVAEVSLFCVFGAMLPFLIANFGVAEELNWRISCALFSFFWITGAYRGIARVRRAGVNVPWFIYFGPISGIIGNGMLWYVVAFVSPFPGAIYTVAIALALAFAALSFVAATFVSGPDTD